MPNNKAKHHEEAVGHCAGAFVHLCLLWVGGVPDGSMKGVLLREGGKVAHHSCSLSILLTFNDGIFWVLLVLKWPSSVTVSLFLIRCERGGSGAESPSLESPGRSQFHTVVQIFHFCGHCAVVSPKSWWPTHQPVLHSFRDKAEWKLKCYDRP